MSEENLPIEMIDYLMVKWKKLASWEYPITSAAGIVLLTITFIYLNYSDATILNHILSTILIMYLCSEFAQRILPEIYQPSQMEQNIDTSQDVSTSEISFMVEGTKSYYRILKDLRNDSPGLFCLVACLILMILGYIGMYIAILPLMYAICMCALILPIMLKKSPFIKEQIAKYSKVIFRALIGTGRKLQTELPIVSSSGRDWIQAKAHVLKEELKIFPRKLGFPKRLTGAFPSLFQTPISYQQKKIFWNQVNEELTQTSSQGIEDLQNNNEQFTTENLNESTDASVSVDENDESKNSKVAQEDVDEVKQLDNVTSEEEQQLEGSAVPEVKAIIDTDGSNKVSVEA